MIQRVQSLYLLASSGVLFSLFFREFTRDLDGIVVVRFSDYTPFLIFTIVTFALSFISIFMYRHRMKQMRVCVYNMLILAAYQAWIAYMFFTRVEGEVFTIATVFPLVALVLTFMAFRKIGHDEALVQSMNSLRDLSKKKHLWKK